jgi:hypothetical protein
MTENTIKTLLDTSTTNYIDQPAWAMGEKEDVIEKMGRLDAAGYFSGKTH